MYTSYVFQIDLKKLYIIFKYRMNNRYKSTHISNISSSEKLVTECVI